MKGLGHTARRVLAIMERYPTADLYEHGDFSGRGTGNYGLCNPAPRSGVLCAQHDVDQMLAAGVIVRKWPDCDGCYILARRGGAEAR